MLRRVRLSCLQNFATGWKHGNLGQSFFEAHLYRMRRGKLVRHHFKCPSPRANKPGARLLLKEDAQGTALEQQRDSVLRLWPCWAKCLTPGKRLASTCRYHITAAQGMAVRVLQIGQPDGVSAKAS